MDFILFIIPCMSKILLQLISWLYVWSATGKSGLYSDTNNVCYG